MMLWSHHIEPQSDQEKNAQLPEDKDSEDPVSISLSVSMEQSTPVSSIAPSPATNPPTDSTLSQSTPAPERRKTHHRTKILRSASPDLPTDFC
jgi:hypothetical protein